LCHLTTLSLVNLEPSTHLHLITQKIKIREKEPKNKEKSQIDFSLLPFLTQHSHHHQNLILPYLKRQFSQVWNPRGGGTNLKHKNSPIFTKNPFSLKSNPNLEFLFTNFHHILPVSETNQEKHYKLRGIVGRSSKWPRRSLELRGRIWAQKTSLARSIIFNMFRNFISD
jgi:hypothetical protein